MPQFMNLKEQSILSIISVISMIFSQFHSRHLMSSKSSSLGKKSEVVSMKSLLTFTILLYLISLPSDQIQQYKSTFWLAML